MKKICFISTIPSTLRTFVLKTAIYLHENTDWDISFICSEDEEFASELPEFIHYFPVPMERGISISGIKSMMQMKKIFVKEKFDLIQYSTPNASLYAALAGKLASFSSDASAQEVPFLLQGLFLQVPDETQGSALSPRRKRSAPFQDKKRI